MFRDFGLLHGAAEAIPLTDVTLSVFVVYGHFGLDTICLFSFLVFPCWGLLWWLPFLRLLSFIHFLTFTLVPHILAIFLFPLFLQFFNLFRLVALLHYCTFLWCFPFLHLLSFLFVFTFTLLSPIVTSHIISLFHPMLLWSGQFLRLVSWFFFPQVLVAISRSSNLIGSFTSPRTNHRPPRLLYSNVCTCCCGPLTVKPRDSGSKVVKALWYKSLVRSQLVSFEFFIDIKSFRSHMALGSTQPLTEMSTRSISLG